MRAIQIAILASGRGTNFDAIYSAISEGRLAAEIKLVLSDRPEALVLEKARARGLRVASVPVQKIGLSPEQIRSGHEKRILEELQKAGSPEFLVLAGYMRVLSPTLIEAYRSERGYSRIVNIHPSLLPAFPGLGAYQQAFEQGVQVTGVTVHLVEKEVDAGPICAQESFSIADCRTAEEVEARGLKLEHRLYPESLSWILEEKFILESRSSGVGREGREKFGKTGRFCVRAN